MLSFKYFVDAARRRALISAFLLAFAAIGLVVSGCSSAPDTPEFAVARKNQAARHAEFGNEQFNRGNYELALRYFELALAENIAVDNLSGIAQSYNSIGRVYFATGNIAEARAGFLDAIRFADLAENHEHRMQAHVNLAVAAIQEDDTDTAAEYLALANAAVEANEAEPNAILFHNTGVLHARTGRFDEARRYLERARDINRADGQWPELASNHYMLASIASREKRYDAAFEDAALALEYDKRAENSPGIAADLRALGTISTHLGNDDEAYQYYLRSLRVYLALNQPRAAVALLDELAETARRTGREAEAMEFRSQRERIEDALTPSGSAVQ